MNYIRKTHAAGLSLLAAAILIITGFFAPVQAQGFKLSPNDTLQSISIGADNMVTFRVYAPSAQEVKLGGTDIPENVKKAAFVKSAEGVWEVTYGPVEPGSYRYNFVVDKVQVIDPKNPKTSESNANTWSLFHIPGNAFMDMQKVPHGTVSEINYYSTVLNKFRRMHVYTPAGYTANNTEYPVLFLLHGAFDCDDSWTTVGRADIILDNLIAEGKVKPMIVVMPAGHTGPFSFAAMRKLGADEFLDEFEQDIKPLVEKSFRTLKGRNNRAIAGLSMGGMHTLNIATPHLQEYAYIGVYSSGVFGIVKGPNSFGNNNGPTWEEQNMKALDDKELKKGLKLFWFATGKDDFLIETSRATVELFKKHGFTVTYNESKGGHTWENWRNYLHEFAPMLFK